MDPIERICNLEDEVDDLKRKNAELENTLHSFITIMTNFVNTPQIQSLGKIDLKDL